MGALFWAWPLLAPQARRYALGLPLLMTTDLGALWLAHHTGAFVDGMGQPEGQAPLLWAMALVALGTAIARGAWRLAVFGAARHIEADWRARLARHWLALPAEGLESQSVGGRIALLTGDIQAIRATAGEGVMAAYDALVMGLLALAYLLYAGGPWLAGAALAPLLVVLPLLISITLWIGPAYAKSQEAYGILSQRVQESVAGIRVIKGFGVEAVFAERLAAVNEAHRQAQIPVWRLESLFEPSIRLALGLSLASALWVGGAQVAQGQLSVGQLIAFFATLSMMAWPLHASGWALGLWGKGKAALARLEAQLAEAEGPRVFPELGPALPAKAPARGMALKLEALAWGPRPEGPYLLGPLDLNLRPGEWLGLFGPVGSGKSLLLELLARWRDPSSGRVWLDDLDARAWPLARLRQEVAVVAQHPHVLARSLGENLALRPEGKTEEAMRHALEVAQLAEAFQSWPEAFDTFLGERGRLLSGGQRQRLEVARSVLAKPRLALLDDPFSALDSSTEARLRESLRAAMAGATVVMVAHRTAALAACDRILVLEGGRPVALATHQELILQGGAYAEVHALECARAVDAPKDREDVGIGSPQA